MPNSLRSNNCNLPPTITGPVLAGKLYLYRTYDSGTAPDTAAETINLRGDAYLWANRTARQNGSWQTVQVREVPPRY